MEFEKYSVPTATELLLSKAVAFYHLRVISDDCVKRMEEDVERFKSIEWSPFNCYAVCFAGARFFVEYESAEDKMFGGFTHGLDCRPDPDDMWKIGREFWNRPSNGTDRLFPSLRHFHIDSEEMGVFVMMADDSGGRLIGQVKYFFGRVAIQAWIETVVEKANKRNMS